MTCEQIAIAEEDDWRHIVVTAMTVDRSVCEAVHEDSVNLLKLLKLNHM